MNQKLALGVILSLSAAALHAGDPKPNWTQNCAGCHGADGAGHTKAGRMVQVKNLTDPACQHSFTDAQAAAQIKNGFKDASGKEKMKAFGDKLSDAEIADLVTYVRSLGAKSS